MRKNAAHLSPDGSLPAVFTRSENTLASEWLLDNGELIFHGNRENYGNSLNLTAEYFAF